MTFADRAGVVLISPLFDDENFGAGDSCPHGWGYRGLYGRHVGADQFLHEIIDVLRKANPKYDGRFYLYGFSAGAQFVGRYIVTHPERVHAAIIASGGWLPVPSAEKSWPVGMGRRRSVKRWPGADEEQASDVQPDPKDFLATVGFLLAFSPPSRRINPSPADLLER